MEIDFLGLHQKDSPKMVKNKSKDMCRDTDSVAGVQWPYSSMVSSPPQFMPFQPTHQGNEQGKFAYDSQTSVFLPVSTRYAFDCNRKPPRPSKKKTWTLPVLDRTVSASTSNFLFNDENVAASPMKQQPLGGISVAEPPSIFPNNGFVNGFDNGTTNLRNNGRLLGPPPQMTIIYANVVHVYQEICPEKVKAILFMAGSSITADTSEISNPVAEDIHSNQPQPLHMLYSQQNSDGTFIGGIPQARKASLARFLEKRKDR